MFKLLIYSILFVVTITSANANYFVTTFNKTEINPELPTRVMLAGSGDDLKLLFQQVAKAKALKYSEQNPGEQILFITASEKDTENEYFLKKWGFTILETEKATLDGREFLKKVLPFKKILSLDIFSHSSAQFGIHLESHTNRLNVNTRGLEDLKNNFMKDSFVVLHGCNTGFNLAPFLSKIWNVPVAGSLTSTNNQKLHSDGNFYLIEEGLFPNSDWAKSNTLSFDEVRACSTGACERLKPDNTPYVGWWGAYREGGLPFYKFFCVNNSLADCSRVMAKALLSDALIVNLKKDSSFEVYKKAVIDFLCPVSAKKDLRGECQAKLDEALVTNDMTYNPFSRPQLECDFKGCQAEVKCEKMLFTVPKPGTCKLENKATALATTLVREYKTYLDAYPYLSK
ncbi:MAG: hypothetical protein K2Q18_17350 [Bdellovibrionales bacterium]|nr:hypothetical protein [Bdellovibrionales bacterium]